MPFPSSGDLPNPGIEPESLMSPALTGGFFTTSTIWHSSCIWSHNLVKVMMLHGYFSTSISVFYRGCISIWRRQWQPIAWKIPRTEEPGRLQFMGSRRVRHGWATSLSLFTFIHWRRQWQPTPVLLPGDSQGRGSLVGCTESDTTEAT